MTESLADISDRNAKSHDRLWKKNDAQDQQLDDHEKRITRLEEHQ